MLTYWQRYEVCPPQVRFVLTSRQESAVLRHFQRQNIPCVRLDAGGEKNQQNVQTYLINQLERSPELRARLVQQKMSADIFVKLLAVASQGNFLYLAWLTPEIVRGARDLNKMSAFPDGLDGIYREFLRTRTFIENLHQWRDWYINARFGQSRRAVPRRYRAPRRRRSHPR